jgi:hypothetical protein
MAEHFIGAVLVADVQVTFRDGTRRDILQKIHEIGPNLAVGFSGSVRFGFEIVDDLLPRDHRRGHVERGRLGLDAPLANLPALYEPCLRRKSGARGHSP